MKLGIETSSRNCSVALFSDSGLVDFLENSSDAYVHAEQLHKMIDQVMSRQKLSYQNLDSVVVGRGPGSYTGLRIGVACAKGLAFANHIPLYSISTLTLMALSQDSQDAFVVMDARRMEVFGAWWRGLVLGTPEPAIIDADWRLALKTDENIVVIGENASKLLPVLKEGDRAIDVLPSAKMMAHPEAKKYMQQEDLAYFEPQYVKAFIPTVSQKS
jgi:tRNA threonylcarbamoyladenosine biosynthesis protein TsaB